MSGFVAAIAAKSQSRTSNTQRREAENHRFGGVGISMARRSKSPASYCCRNTASPSCHFEPMIWLFAPYFKGRDQVQLEAFFSTGQSAKTTLHITVK